ncbi:unnamed protein product, partial [Phaeothamnion confervicola]
QNRRAASSYHRSRSQEEEEQLGRGRESRGDAEDCPICLGPCLLQVGTNCNHQFCAKCFLEYANSVRGLKIKCPCCRSEVNLLHQRKADATSGETEASTAEGRATSDGTRAVERDIAHFNTRYAGARSLGQTVRDAPILLRYLLSDIVRGDGRIFAIMLRRTLVSYQLLQCLLGVLYIVSPVDFLPEAVVGILGYLDDVLVFLFALVYISTLYRVAL